MLPRHQPDGIHIAFDDHRLVNNAGLILPATLASHLGPALRAARWGLPKGPRPESNAASSQCSGGLVPSPATLVPGIETC